MKKWLNKLAGIFSLLVTILCVIEFIIIKSFKENYIISCKYPVIITVFWIVIAIIHAVFIIFADNKISQILLIIPIVPILIKAFPFVSIIYIIAYIISKEKYKKIIAIIIGVCTLLFVLFWIFLYFAFVDPHISYPNEEYISPGGEYIVIIEKREFDDGRNNEIYIRYRMNQKKEFLIYEMHSKKERTLDLYLPDGDNNMIKWLSDSVFEFAGKKYVLAYIS